MNIMKKTGTLLLLLTLLFSLAGCTGPEQTEKSLREHGMDVVRLMSEMVQNADYGELFGTSMGELEEIRASLAAGDYTAPLAVYEITIPDITNVMMLLGADNAMNSFSDSLKAHLNSRSASALISQLNALKGSTYLASASIYTAGKTFVSNELEENTLYVYTFQNGYSIAVTFLAGEDHSVTATGTFLMGEDFRADSMEQIGDLLKKAGFTGVIRQVPDTP